MARHRGVPIIKYDDVFFQWLRTQLLMVEDYVYARIDFGGEPYMALTDGSQWGDLGKKEVLFYIMFLLFLMIQNCFFVIYSMTNQVLFDNADVGPYHPPGSSPIQR